MTPLYLLDASICIHLLRGRPDPGLRRRFVEDVQRACLSSLVLTELLVGVEKTGSVEARVRLNRFCARLTILDFDAEAAAHAANIRADLERRGVKIGPFDTLIAGHARSLSAVLVTGKLREFSRVEGLRCEDWIEPIQGFSE